ncbi:thioredoxin domain-containing protein [Microbacterium sp. SLBN-146]|uniref:thioredoxin domain-containing protein n=1 Tax=Microbacterium sp. SLBN-146 TaxID=2768457 RepID=UPI0011548E40|nr:DUF255 domain-containing protein [Microbacterium sp. SLBN-146]TQJ31609.1 hypothetical protein FBY39_2088 [Microbacterium sp. SLBN-146]
MNERLSSSASPYLRAHADNPVAWYPWGREAFDEARRRDVPVFVSIGYSTCHWCHVMARELFADRETAADLDAGFVSIKVDREEHPEVDAAYMAAAAAFTLHLGWPLSVFVTPDGHPFFAGTYFPPSARGGVPAFRDVLGAVREAWTERREQVAETADALVQALASARAHGTHGGGGLPDVAALASAAQMLAAREDPEYGGLWGGDPVAPKFPVATALRFLQHPVIREAAPGAAAVAERALAAMSSSPLRDVIEGGFFRYATRRDWSIPHYERMLTDNALLLDVAAAADDGATARGIASFLTLVLQQPAGGFGAAQDSESWIDGRRSEGGYYLVNDRAGLQPPAVDGKVVTGWNGLAIGALARAGARLGTAEWIEAARWAADAVLTINTTADGRLVRASLDEIPSRAAASLADYGQLASGLTALAIATGEPAYVERARALLDACMRPNGEPTVPGGGDGVLSAQGMGAPDAASDADEPSGLAALAETALALWQLGAGESYRVFAEECVARHRDAALAQPLAHGTLLRVGAGLAVAPRQIVVVADSADDPLVRTARAVEADVVIAVTSEQAAAWAASGFDLFAGKSTQDGRATAYDCRNFSCRLPVTEPADLDEAGAR